MAVDVTGLPVGAAVVPASTHENGTAEQMLEHLTEQGVAGWLQVACVATTLRHLSRAQAPRRLDKQ